MYEAQQKAALVERGLQAGMPIGPMSMSDKLRLEKEHLETRLKAVNEAIAALESDEKIARAVDAITRLGHF